MPSAVPRRFHPRAIQKPRTESPSSSHAIPIPNSHSVPSHAKNTQTQTSTRPADVTSHRTHSRASCQLITPTPRLFRHPIRQRSTTAQHRSLRPRQQASEPPNEPVSQPANEPSNQPASKPVNLRASPHAGSILQGWTRLAMTALWPISLRGSAKRGRRVEVRQEVRSHLAGDQRKTLAPKSSLLASKNLLNLRRAYALCMEAVSPTLSSEFMPCVVL